MRPLPNKRLKLAARVGVFDFSPVPCSLSAVRSTDLGPAMGMDLTSESRATFRWNGSGWTFLLNLAQRYDWRPVGTQAPPTVENASWSGAYDSNEGQRVTADDARALGVALERAVADSERTRKAEELALEISVAVREQTGYADYHVGVPESIWGYLEEFADFCKKGGFNIE